MRRSSAQRPSPAIDRGRGGLFSTTMALCVLALAVGAATAFAAAGALDTSFDGNGKQIINFGGDDDAADGVAIQSDGKVVAVGASEADPGPSSFGPVVTRLRSDGSLDPTFSSDGKRFLSFGGDFRETAEDVALVPRNRGFGNNGMVVVGSSLDDGDNRFTVARLLANGALDDSFSNDGKKVIQLGNGYPHALNLAVALQPDGKIVVAGSLQIDGETEFGFVRLNTDGALDPTFSHNGVHSVNFPGDGCLNDIALDENGKIVAVGRQVVGGNQQWKWAIARLSSHGSLDQSFSGDGKIVELMGDSNGFAEAGGLGIQGNGKIVVGGTAYVNTARGEDFALIRYTPAGAIDPGFGRRFTDLSSTGISDDHGRDVVIQPGQPTPGGRVTGLRIIVVGQAGEFGDQHFAVARYLPNGRLDTGFSEDGLRRVGLGGSEEQATAVATSADRRIVVVGQARNLEFGLARLLGN